MQTWSSSSVSMAAIHVNARRGPWVFDCGARDEPGGEDHAEHRSHAPIIDSDSLGISVIRLSTHSATRELQDKPLAPPTRLGFPLLWRDRRGSRRSVIDIFRHELLINHRYIRTRIIDQLSMNSHTSYWFFIDIFRHELLLSVVIHIIDNKDRSGRLLGFFQLPKSCVISNWHLLSEAALVLTVLMRHDRYNGDRYNGESIDDSAMTVISNKLIQRCVAQSHQQQRSIWWGIYYN